MYSAPAQYRESQINTASREKLLLMVYDGLLRFIAEGRRAMVTQDYEAQNANLAKAQRLFIELICTLDHAAAPEIARDLDRLYRYMHDRLASANVHDDTAALDDVSRLVSDLRETWAEAALLARNPEANARVGMPV